MYITCPNCNFQRSVDKKQIPASATVVTCPKCEHRFKFKDLETGEFLSEICQEPEKSMQDEVLLKKEISSLYEEQEDSNVNNLEKNSSIPTDILRPENDLQNEKLNQAEHLSKNVENSAEPVSYGEDKEPLTENEVAKHEKVENEEDVLAQYENIDEDAKKKRQKIKMMTDDVPWEHPERYGILGSLTQTIARVMFKAPEFFSTIHSQSSMLRPATFYALLGLFQTLCLQIWLSTLSSVDILVQYPGLEENLQQFSMPMTIVLSPFLAIFQLLLFSAFLYLAIRITNPDKADYNLCLRVIAYAYSPTILSIVPYFGPMLGLIWFVCNIFIGVKYAMSLSWQRTFLALSPIFLLWIFVVFSTFSHVLN